MAVRDIVDATEIDEVELEGVSRPVKIYGIREKEAEALLMPASVGFDLVSKYPCLC